MKELERFRFPQEDLFRQLDFFQNREVWVDLEEDGERIYVTADLPGIPKEGIVVQLDAGSRLIIEGQQSQEVENTGRTYLQRERRQGRFIRTIQLPVEVDNEDIQAHYQKGTLKISLKKAHQRKVQYIPVQ